MHRISAEQAAVEARLLELDGMDAINTSLKKTKIIAEDEMIVDPPPEPPSSRTLEAKRKALSQAVRFHLLALIFVMELILKTLRSQSPGPRVWDFSTYKKQWI